MYTRGRRRGSPLSHRELLRTKTRTPLQRAYDHLRMRCTRRRPSLESTSWRRSRAPSFPARLILLTRSIRTRILVGLCLSFCLCPILPSFTTVRLSSSSPLLLKPALIKSFLYLAGMPMPYVHLIPPPLSLALDARITGSEARFARSGCRPNAVLRPVLCRRRSDNGKGKEKGKAKEQHHEQRRTQSPEAEYDPTMPPPRFPASSTNGLVNGVSSIPNNNVSATSTSPTSLTPSNPKATYTTTSSSSDNNGHDEPPEDRVSFAIFALRDLKASEEVVLGWEWDDGSVVHQLPALVEALAFAGAETGNGQAAAGPSKMTYVFPPLIL